MSRKKELSYLSPLPMSYQKNFKYNDFISFIKINEYLDFEELSLLEHEKADEPYCQPLGVFSLSEWITCNEFNWVAEGALQHSFAVYCILMILFGKFMVRKCWIKSGYCQPPLP